MMKRVFTGWALALIALGLAVAAFLLMAQTTQLNSAFPNQAAGEFGPQSAVDDGLPFGNLVTTDSAVIHQDNDGAPDNVGAFRFICNPAQNNGDDPLIAPGQKGGAPHQHQWYGNTGGNFASTYASLRTTGDSTCAGLGNRTAYWMPAMLSGGRVLRPDYLVIYYKRFPKGSPQCTPGNSQYVGECVGVPNNLHMIFGYDFLTGKVATGARGFKCVFNSANRSDYKTDIVEAATSCQLGDDLFALLHAPGCWDGVNLDSPNHRDHMAYVSETTGKCPSTHPKHIPDFTVQAAYKVDANLNRSGTWTPGQNTWYFASDKMPGMPVMRPGTTFHQDYFEAWNSRVKKAWTDNCIDRLLTCVAGDLGNGYTMKPTQPVTFIANPRYVPVPTIRGGRAKGMGHAMAGHTM